jgi:predicted nucleic acid-binding protein
MAEVSRAVLDTNVLVATDVPVLEGELAVSAAALAELHVGTLVTDEAQVRAERVRRLTLIEHLYRR